jgi:uncharacterized membrane protein YciS (DUF1049 family)
MGNRGNEELHMKYFKTFAPIIAIFVVALIGIAITSPSAGVAGYRSSGLLMVTFGIVIVWFILEMFAIGKKEPEASEQKKE